MSLNSNGAFHGRHALAEMFNVSSAILDDVDFLSDLIRSASLAAGATVCDVIHKKFEPQGVTVLAMLEESHASFHTYPEFGSLFIDIFTCGEKCDPEKAVDLIRERLGCATYSYNLILRSLARPELSRSPLQEQGSTFSAAG
ncbi:adenosylmethionine decarboxylase [Pseudomonas sp. COR18]|uniref:adenosylmethionine decarboxylase n=1 Tax=Pseudomonas sp. COR18 TaxID=3399680 RepID=UPI003AFFDB30